MIRNIIILASILMAYESSFEAKNYEFAQTNSYSTEIEPGQTISITNPVSGTIHAWHANLGDKVAKDETILTLKTADIKNRLHEKIIKFLEEKIKYQEISAKLRTQEQTFKLGNISKEKLNETKALKVFTFAFMLSLKNEIYKLIENRDITIDLDNFELENVYDFFQDTSIDFDTIKIKAPESGVLTLASIPYRNLKVGSFLKQDANFLDIARLEEYKVKIFVPETAINDLKVGQNVKIKGAGFKGTVLPGTIDTISEQSTFRNGNGFAFFDVTIFAKVPTVNNNIRIGMSAIVNIANKKTTAIGVPLKAVFYESDQPFAKVIENGETVSKKIVTGIIDNGYVEVIDGINLGDMIVVPS